MEHHCYPAKTRTFVESYAQPFAVSPGISETGIPCQIEQDYLLIQKDRANMLRLLGADIKLEAFHLSGAYGHGRTHSRDHEHSHAHAHDYKDDHHHEH